MLAHDWLDGFGRLISMVERDGGDVVVQDVSLDYAMEELSTDEAELAIDRCCGAACEIPGFWLVVWEGGISVLKVGDGD